MATEPKEIVLFVTPDELSNIWLSISTLIGKVKTTQKRREDPVAIFNALDKITKKELWKVVKDYTSLVILDNVLRPLLGQNSFPKLPDRTLFQSNAPSRVDSRRVALEEYFFSILSMPKIPPFAARALCEFLSTDTIDPMDVPDTPSKREGYLTKRGKKIRGWKVRYFIIEGDYLNYYDKPGGELQSSIYLRGAKIGRQTKTETETNSEDSLEKEFRHAFLVVEPKKKDQVRHVLCAESDEDRDMWIDSLLEIIALPAATPSPTEIVPSSPKKSPIPFSAPENVPASPMTSLPASASRETLSSKQSSRSVLPSPTVQAPYNSLQGQPILPPISNQRLKTSYSMESTSNTELSHTVSLEEEYETAKQDVKKQKKKGFFAQFRNRGNNTNSHGHSASVSVQSGYQSQRFQATPYSAVEQKQLLPTTRVGMVNPNPGKHDVAGLHALGVSLEEAILSQKDLQHPPSHFDVSPPQSANSEKFEKVRRVFGIPLAEAVKLAPKNVHHCKVPAIVYRCIELLKVRGAIFEEGIFRLSGSTSTIRGLKERFNAEYDIDLVNSEIYYDIHAVAGLLKLYLREIPSLILSSYLAPEFRDAVDIPDVKTKVLKLKSLVQELPEEHRDLLCVLCSLLTEIISHSEINKMNLRNVGIVFAPTLNISASVLINFLTDFDGIFGDSSTNFSTGHLDETAAAPVASPVTAPVAPVVVAPIPVPARRASVVPQAAPIVSPVLFPSRRASVVPQAAPMVSPVPVPARRASIVPQIPPRASSVPPQASVRASPVPTTFSPALASKPPGTPASFPTPTFTPVTAIVSEESRGISKVNKG